MQISKSIKAQDLPRCIEMYGSTLKIVPACTEAGYFQEANCVTITDGERTAIYVPFKIITKEEVKIW